MHTQTLVKCVSVCVWKRDWSTWRTDGLGYRSSTHIHSNPHTQTHSNTYTQLQTQQESGDIAFQWMCVWGSVSAKQYSLFLQCRSVSLHLFLLSCTSYHSLKSCFGWTLLCLLIIMFPTLHAGSFNIKGGWALSKNISVLLLLLTHSKHSLFLFFLSLFLSYCSIFHLVVLYPYFCVFPYTAGSYFQEESSESPFYHLVQYQTADRHS